MIGGATGVTTGNERLYPVVAGAVVGLGTGLAGMFATILLYTNPLGGFVGAVFGGVTAAYLSNGGFYDDVAHAIVADVVSSVAFFLLVLVGYLGYIWFTDGLSIISAIWFTFMYLVLGGLGAAVPIGIVSLVITGVSGAVTALAKERTAELDAPG